MTLTAMLPDHLPPQSLEFEQATLGAALISTSAAEWVRDELFREVFYIEPHRLIYDALCWVLDLPEGRADSLTVCEELRRRGQLEPIGGMAYINALWESVPTAAHVEYYGKEILQLAVTRSLASRCQKIIGAVHARELPFEELLSWAESQILGIDQRAKSQPNLAGPEALALTALGNVMGGDEVQPVLPTGWHQLDRIIRGLPEGLMSIIAGRPGNGKTTLELAWLLKMVQEGIPSLVFSTETPKSQIMRRITAMQTGIAASRLWPTPDEAQEGSPKFLSPAEFQRVVEAADAVRGLPLYLDDEAELTVSQIRSRIRRAKKQYGIRQVFVDQLQTIVRNPGENDNSSLTNEVIYPLQRLARAEGVSLTLLCQLSRNSERREKNSRRPILSDLRDSGSLEQAARMVVMVHRPNYYEDDPTLENADLEVLIRKNNEGATGAIGYRWNLPTFRLSEIDHLHEDTDAPPTSGTYG